jgi:hypothetical protein
MPEQVLVSLNGLAARASRARSIALDMAGGRASLLRPLADGSVIIVNYPGFDTSVWDRPKAKKGKRS